MRKKISLKNNTKHIKNKKILKAKGIGWISIILAIAAGSLVIGGFLFIPNTPRTRITTEYITIPDPSCEGDNLHACTFIVVTVTPTPRPTRTPDDDDENNNGNNNGGSKPTKKPKPPGPQPL